MITLEKPTIQQDSSIQGGKNAPLTAGQIFDGCETMAWYDGPVFSISQVTSNFSLLNNFKPTKFVLDFVRRRIPETHHHC